MILASEILGIDISIFKVNFSVDLGIYYIIIYQLKFENNNFIDIKSYPYEVMFKMANILVVNYNFSNFMALNLGWFFMFLMYFLLEKYP